MQDVAVSSERGEALSSFVEGHAGLIRRLARDIARNHLMRRDAEDVAQQVALALLQARLDPTQLLRAEAYLVTVVRRASYRACRRQRGFEMPLPGNDADQSDAHLVDPQALEAYHSIERGIDGARRIERLRGRLRPRDAAALQVLAKRGAEAPDGVDLAQALGTNANNVYQIRHRIGRALDALIEEESCDEQVPPTVRSNTDESSPPTLPEGAGGLPTIPCPAPLADDVER